jgi:hypothetical protein
MNAGTGPDRRRIVTCHQPTYLPWGGLFHKLHLADLLVVMDTVGYSSKGWQNRTRIKGPQGAVRLVVPLAARTRTAPLRDIEIAAGGAPPSRDWQHRHWRSLQVCYARAPYWHRYSPVFEEIYLGRRWLRLADLNLALLDAMIELFGIGVTRVRASEIGETGRKSRLIQDYCQRTSAAVYISGIHGYDYLIEDEFAAGDISVFYQSYRSAAYPQRFGEFVSDLSAVDLLFNLGAEAAAHTMFADNVSRAALLAELDRYGAPAILDTVPYAGGGQVRARAPRRREVCAA